MQLLLLTAGLGLLSVLGAQGPQLTPAHAQELVGRWHIKLWAGTLRIPAHKRSHPLPPFTLAMNRLQKLEFRMNLTKPIGCVLYKLPLDFQSSPGIFNTWWRHLIYISFLPGKEHAIAYFQVKVDTINHYMMMLMGRSLDEDPEAVRTFEEFAESKGLNRTDIARPPPLEACELPPDS
ncbi:lipocalin-1-like [Lepus europaeus]|uniref:lipocalin-1-like n=1 Tax=Lepus europaeus TaxID=9983 RepID=UPI002B46A72E|nr:lipocalin-1-like [Lepus europaeus]